MIEVASTTQIGNRSENQDAFEICELETGTLAFLADGAGGHQDGAMAAQSICRHLASSAMERVQEFSAITFNKDKESDAVRNATNLIRELITQSAFAMGEELKAANPKTNAHTTLVLCWASTSVTLFANIGDSRTYLVHDSGIELCSRDHSMAQWRLEKGEITEEQLCDHPDRHRLYRMISTAKPARASISVKPAMRSQHYALLCSDGWWEQITANEMRSLSQQDSLAPWLDSHAATAVERAGGRSDNVTALVLRKS